MLGINLTKKCSLIVILVLASVYNSAFALGLTALLTAKQEAMGLNSFVDSISANGRFVSFTAQSKSPPGEQRSVDVFLYDRLTKQSTQVSHSIFTSILLGVGTQQKYIGLGRRSSLSADGRYMAYESSDTDFYPGSKLALFDRTTKQTATINEVGSTIQNPQLSSDGRYIAYQSLGNVFVYDRLTKKINPVSVNSSGIVGNGISSSPRINADGRYVSFVSDADNLVDNDTNDVPDVFVHDRQTKKTIRVSVSSNGIEGNYDSYGPSISANGNFVAFVSEASNLTPNDTNTTTDIFVHNRFTKQTTRIDNNWNGLFGNSLLNGPNTSISADGRYVAFESTARKFDGFITDAIIHDRQLNLSLASNDFFQYGPRLSGSGNNLSATGQLVFSATNLEGFHDPIYSYPYSVFINDHNFITAFDFTADLKITAVAKPKTLAFNQIGSYAYIITNNGPNNIDGDIYGINNLKIDHLLSNGKLMALKPSQGSCKSYATISVCDFGSIAAGGVVTLLADIKAIRTPLSQQLSVVTEIADPKPANNYIDIATPVTP